MSTPNISNISSIFLLCPNWVGDFIMASPIYRALRKKFPQAEITLGMKPGLEHLIAGSNWHNNIFIYDKARHHKGFKGWLKLAKELKTYDLTIILPNSVRSGLIGYLTRAKIRLGYNRPGKLFLLTHSLKRGNKNSMYTGDYYIQLLSVLDIKPEPYLELPLSQEIEKQADQIWQQAQETSLKIVITPGASFGSSKLWPEKHLATLIDLLCQKKNATIVMVGGPKEESLIKNIQKMAKHSFIVQPPGLEILKGLIAKADLLICNDTGPRHIAHAFRTPAVVLMGPNDPLLTYTRLENGIVLRNPVPCSPCKLKVCRYSHHACMQQLQPDFVYETAMKFLHLQNSENALPLEPMGYLQPQSYINP